MSARTTDDIRIPDPYGGMGAGADGLHKWLRTCNGYITVHQLTVSPWSKDDMAELRAQKLVKLERLGYPEGKPFRAWVLTDLSTVFDRGSALDRMGRPARLGSTRRASGASKGRAGR